MSNNFDPANPDSYRTFSPYDLSLEGEHAEFQRLYDIQGAFDALASMMERGASSILSEMPDEFEQKGIAHIIKALAQQVHDCAAWIEDHYTKKEKNEKTQGAVLRAVGEEVANA